MGSYATGFGKWARAALGGKSAAMTRASEEMKLARANRAVQWTTDDDIAFKTCATVVRVGRAIAADQQILKEKPRHKATTKSLEKNEERFDALLNVAAAHF